MSHVIAERYSLKGPGGPADNINRRIIASGVSGGKLFVVQDASPTAELYVFDLKKFSGASGDEPDVTADEFYALKEEVHEIHKLIADRALGGTGSGRGPGRPRKEETVTPGA